MRDVLCINLAPLVISVANRKPNYEKESTGSPL